MMMAYAMNVLRKQGKRSVHILVREGHEVASVLICIWDMRKWGNVVFMICGLCALERAL